VFTLKGQDIQINIILRVYRKIALQTDLTCVDVNHEFSGSCVRQVVLPLFISTHRSGQSILFQIGLLSGRFARGFAFTSDSQKDGRNRYIPTITEWHASVHLAKSNKGRKNERCSVLKLPVFISLWKKCETMFGEIFYLFRGGMSSKLY